MVFGLELKSNRAKAISWFFVLGILAVLMLAFFPLLQDDNMLSLANGFREGFSERFRMVLGMGYDVQFDKFTEYLPFMFQYLGILFAIFGVQLGARSLSKEQSAGTIEYLYANPVSRMEIYSGKFSADLLLYGLVLVAVLAVSFVAAYLFGIHDLRALALVLLQIFICLLLLGFIFLSLGFFYSALSSRSSHAEGGSLLLLILLFIVWAVLIALGSGAATIAGYFPFTVFNPLAMATGAGFQWLGIAIDLVLAVILWLLGSVVYTRKELKF
ncbi:ABC-2 type transport system permease protein [Peptoniphilus ivorii]|uniref:ABC transporter permease subunit n=1 Tax=Aedoeadaptatus ivorii TaxID=54006 RepID=UPI002788970F|nr:ABC transporter permease subunit [Peptoniphilus ivorii]MDQ0507743.1 ABC-2 type transport system permease protein [Peptoniphilus ivorii]